MDIEEVRKKFEKSYKSRIAGHVFFEGKYLSTRGGLKNRADTENTREINALWQAWSLSWSECLSVVQPR